MLFERMKSVRRSMKTMMNQSAIKALFVFDHETELTFAVSFKI